MAQVKTNFNCTRFFCDHKGLGDLISFFKRLSDLVRMENICAQHEVLSNFQCKGVSSLVDVKLEITFMHFFLCSWIHSSWLITCFLRILELPHSLIWDMSASVDNALGRATYVTKNGVNLIVEFTDNLYRTSNSKGSLTQCWMAYWRD